MTHPPTTPRPDEDEREDLRLIVRANLPGTVSYEHWTDIITSAVLAAGFTRTPAPRSTKEEWEELRAWIDDRDNGAQLVFAEAFDEFIEADEMAEQAVAVIRDKLAALARPEDRG